MGYRVILSPAVRDFMKRLPDFLLVDCYLRFQGGLTLAQMLREPEGMKFRFSVVDPANRMVEHVCTFRLLFSQDEQSVILFGLEYRCSAAM